MAETPLCEKLIGTHGFSRQPMTPPPSERGGKVIQFELTTGCSHGRCTFCDVYSHTPYQEKPIEEFKEHVDSVLDFVAENKKIRPYFDYPVKSRVFIGAGDALGVDNEKFIQACQVITESFSERDETFLEPDRFAVYGSVKNILKKKSNLYERIP